MVPGKLPVPGRPTIWMIVGQGPTAVAVGAGGGLFGHFNSPLSPSLWKTGRYRPNYCIKGPLNSKATTTSAYECLKIDEFRYCLPIIIWVSTSIRHPSAKLLSFFCFFFCITVKGRYFTKV